MHYCCCESYYSFSSNPTIMPLVPSVCNEQVMGGWSITCNPRSVPVSYFVIDSIYYVNAFSALSSV